MSASAIRLHAVVVGLVQGVNFRQTTRQRAQALGLTGWVRNQADGSVEVLAEGPRPAVEALREFLGRGPRLAQVESVQVDWQAATGEFTQFLVDFA